MDFTVPLSNTGSMSITFLDPCSLDPGTDPNSVRKLLKRVKPLRVAKLKKDIQKNLQATQSNKNSAVTTAKKEHDDDPLCRQPNPKKTMAMPGPKTLKPIHILTEINAGSSKNPISVANLHFNAGNHSVYIGSEKGPYIQIKATGRAHFTGNEIDLIKGKIVGLKGASITSANNIKIGRLNQYDTMPSGILSGAEVVLDTHTKILLEASYIFGETGVGFRVGQIVDNISGHIISGGDVCLDTTQFHNRLLTELVSLGGRREDHPCANIFESYKRYVSKMIAKSEPAYLMAGKVFATNADIENLGSYIHFDSFQGNRNESARIKHFIAYTTWVHEMFCGHESYGRCRWYYAYKVTSDKLYQSVFSSNTKLNIKSKKLNCTGKISAPELNLSHFDEAIIGPTEVEVELPAPKKFKTIIQLPAIQSPRYEYIAGVYYSILPKLCTMVHPPAVIFNSDGFLSLMSSKMSAFMPEDMEEETLVKTLLHEFGKGSLDKDTTDPALMLYKLLNNAWKMVNTGCTSSTGLDYHGNPKWYSKLNDPLLVYKEMNVDGQFKCWPHLIVPLSWDNPKLRDGAFGLFSSGNINIRGANRQTSKLIITAHIDAKGMVRFSNMKSLKFQKLLHVEKRLVEDTFITESWGGLRRKTQSNKKEVRIVTPQSGNRVDGEGVYINNVGNVHFNAAEINAGDKGITAKNVDSIIATAVDATKMISKHSSAESVANYAEHNQNIIEHTLVPSRFQTTGRINLQTNDQQAYHSAEMLARKDIELDTGNALLLGAATVAEEQPTMMQSKTFTIAVTTGNATHGIPVTMVSMEGHIHCKSEGTIVNVGTKMLAKEVRQTADKQLTIEPLRLEENYQTSARGFRGLKYINQNKDERHESGVLATMVAQQSIALTSKKSNILLIAPRLFAGDVIQFSAPNGTFSIIPASFHHDVSMQEFSVGVSFFGSKAVEAAMQKDFKEAARSLLREFPLLDSIERDLKSKDTADKIGNGMRTLYYAYKAYKDFVKSDDLQKFIAGQIPTDVNVRFGTSESHHFWTELALPWLQAKTIIADAKNIQSTGTQATCENLTLKATGTLNLDAAKQESHSETHSAGVTAGVDCLTGAPSLGLDYSTSENKALEYITSRFNVSGTTTLTAGGKLSLRGTLIETLKAVLEAESMVLKTEQDESHGSHFSAHASTKGSAGFSAGKHDRKFAKDQTGILAKETLIANIKKEIHLLGAVIEVGTKAKPVQIQLPDGKAVAFYELGLTENGVLGLLGLSPDKILKQLHDPKWAKLPEVSTALQKQFALAVWDSTLPKTLQTEQTQGWRRLLKDTAESLAIVTKEIAEKIKKEALAEFLIYKLKNLDKLDLLDRLGGLDKLERLAKPNINLGAQNTQGAVKHDIDILNIAAKLSGLNIRLWNEKAEVVVTPKTEHRPAANLDKVDSPLTAYAQTGTAHATSIQINTNVGAANTVAEKDIPNNVPISRTNNPVLGSHDKTTNAKPNNTAQNQKQVNTNIAEAPKNQNPSLKILKTEGCGDCAFHAIFGKWDSKIKKVFCPTVPQKRKKLANEILKLKSQSPMFPLVVAVIQEMLDNNKPLFGKLKTAYKQHGALNKQLSETAWRKLEVALKSNKTTAEFIAIGSQDIDHLKNFKQQFQYCLRLEGGILRTNIIPSFGNINTLFEEYNRQTNATFDLDRYILQDKTVLIEYAKYLQKMGQILLPHEVNIIAFTFNKNIKFITYNRHLRKYTAPENLNPKGKDPVGVSFNGLNHFEKVEGDYILAFAEANAVNACPNVDVVNVNSNANVVGTNLKANAVNANNHASASINDAKQSKDTVESKNLKESGDSTTSKHSMDLNKSKDANESKATKDTNEIKARKDADGTQDIQIYKTITIDPKADTLNLKYSAKTKRWSVYHSQPGLVMASGIYGSDVLDRETSTEIGMNVSNSDVGNFFNSDAPKAPTEGGGGSGPVSGTFDADLRSSEKERINRASVLGAITLNSPTVSGVNQDGSQKQEMLVDEQHHYGAFVPTGNSVEIVNDMSQTATNAATTLKNLALPNVGLGKAKDTKEIAETSKNAKKTADTSKTSTSSASSAGTNGTTSAKGTAGAKGSAGAGSGTKQNTNANRTGLNPTHGTSGSSGSGSTGGSRTKGNASGLKNKANKTKTANTPKKNENRLLQHDDSEEISLYPSRDQLQAALLNSIKPTQGSKGHGTGISFIGTANAGECTTNVGERFDSRKKPKALTSQDLDAVFPTRVIARDRYAPQGTTNVDLRMPKGLDSWSYNPSLNTIKLGTPKSNQSSWLGMFWRSLNGERGDEIIAFQKRNRERGYWGPKFAAVSDTFCEGYRKSRQIVSTPVDYSPSTVFEHPTSYKFINDWISPIGKGIENFRNNFINGALNPFQTLSGLGTGLGTLIWDASGFGSQVCFRTCTEGSRIRNRARAEAFVHEWNRFANGDVSTRMEMGTEYTTSLVFAFAGAGTAAKPGGVCMAVKKNTHSYNISKNTIEPIIESDLVYRTLNKIAPENNFLIGYERFKNRNRVITLDPQNIKFSQTSISDVGYWVDRMRLEGWKCPAIDIVRLENGSFVSLDNTRLFAASLTGTPVRAVVRSSTEPLSTLMKKRFKTKQDGVPNIWGEAMEFRVNKQNAGYRQANPEGSNYIGISEMIDVPFPANSLTIKSSPVNK